MKTSYEHNRVEGRSPLPLYQLGHFGDSVSLAVTVSILGSCIMDGCILRDDIALLRLRLNVMLFVNETGDTLGNDNRKRERFVRRHLLAVSLFQTLDKTETIAVLASAFLSDTHSRLMETALHI